VAQARAGLSVARSSLAFFTQYSKEQHGLAVMLQKISNHSFSAALFLPFFYFFYSSLLFFPLFLFSFFSLLLSPMVTL